MPDTPLPFAPVSASPGIPDAADPFGLFRAWMEEASRTEPNDPNAMTVATCTPDGMPSARIVLLKDIDDRGFVFYTNKQGRKGVELRANPRAALLFHWKTLGRQVRVEGAVEDVSDVEADAYYASRARISRLGAWASEQSRPLAGRHELERRVAELDARYPGDDIPRPPHWSGLRVVPAAMEFWQDMPFRLHDRRTYLRDGPGANGEGGAGWTAGRLYP